MNKLILVGSGGFAKELYQYLQNTDHEILGYIDKQKSAFYELSYLGDEESIHQSFFKEASFLLGIGQVELRASIIAKLKARGANFFSFIHSSAIVASDALLGEGVVLCPNSMLNAGAQLEDFVLLNIYASVAHDCVVGENSILCPYATLNGEAKTGKNCFLGTGASLLPKARLGNNCVLSAGVMLSKSYKDNQLIFNLRTLKVKTK
ncbi:transferase [Campylobacter sp. MIT 12-8780]|uniref:NeuD/PglB/VioB family sugar acetyltransferase n=1 Tax=unclassified Campylobacter TaxID=2593542 RepID=UPI00115F36E2|nr:MULTISPECIES: NeuD/PglB/VioB family sugar acetyltransferase [unclassified Campylobacter]NDJ26732.1 transferase [Campylobacter sp. MIT 19-121]TQR42441.1 transferase [Campylobacter sp. MIT 12-8780]